MNYLAQGINQGFEAGGRAYDNKKKRKQEDDLARAERELRVDQQARELENRRTLQDAENTFRGTQSAEERAARSIEAEKQRGFVGGENALDRGFRQGERIDSQGFQSGESALDRAARTLAQDKQLKQQQDFHDIELPLKGAALGMQARHQDWQENPENPQNKALGALEGYRDAAAGRFRDDYGAPMPAPNAVTINGGAPSPLTPALRAPQQVNGGRPQLTGQPAPTPPPSAVEYLRKNPALAAEFDRKYGTGAAAKLLQGAR